jgi:hypothetical protein
VQRAKWHRLLREGIVAVKGIYYILLSILKVFASPASTMQQLERLYRYNEEVGPFFLELPVSSPADWRDACIDDRCNVAPAAAAAQQSELSLPHLASHACPAAVSHVLPNIAQASILSGAVKASLQHDAAFQSPRSPATRSCCSTPRKFY